MKNPNLYYISTYVQGTHPISSLFNIDLFYIMMIPNVIKLEKTIIKILYILISLNTWS